MVKEIPDVIDKPQFLKFIEVYAKKFKAQNGFGNRWLHEYQDMEARGLFKPAIIKALYKKILLDKFYLGFIREQAIYYIGVNAQDAAEAYYKIRESYLYKITIITGETAVDDDDDEYVNLEYDEAVEICKALNEEAEEELFYVKRM
jgi:hypothetical protein